MTQPPDPADLLTGEQQKKLRGLGHRLEPVVYIGREGLSPALVKSAEAALTARELIKIKVGQNCPVDRTAAGRELGRLTGAAVVQIIGRMTLLYRANPDLPPDRRIALEQVQGRPAR
mgnify:FL=1